MGRGNWYPGNDVRECTVVYIDYSRDEFFDDDLLADWEWECVKDAIYDALPKSFIRVDELLQLPYLLRQPRWRDCSPLAYNGLFTLWCDNQGEPHHLGIGFTNEDSPAFARSKLCDMSESFFDKLSKSLTLSVRRCAWTSEPYRQQQGVA